jgi:hypothetical protein
MAVGKARLFYVCSSFIAKGGERVKSGARLGGKSEWRRVALARFLDDGRLEADNTSPRYSLGAGQTCSRLPKLSDHQGIREGNLDG